MVGHEHAHRLRIAVTFLPLAALLAGCRSAETNADSASRPLTPEALPELVIQEADAPPGFVYRSEAFDVSSLRPELRSALLDQGFIAAWGAGFSTETYGPNAASVVMLFDEESGAAFAMRLMPDDLASLLGYTDALPEPFDTHGLGDESIGLQQQGGFSGPLYVLFWRVDNVMLMISSGAIDESHLRVLAEAMQQRTERKSSS